jgi:hypothetical protein
LIFDILEVKLIVLGSIEKESLIIPVWDLHPILILISLITWECFILFLVKLTLYRLRIWLSLLSLWGYWKWLWLLLYLLSLKCWKMHFIFINIFEFLFLYLNFFLSAKLSTKIIWAKLKYKIIFFYKFWWIILNYWKPIMI